MPRSARKPRVVRPSKTVAGAVRRYRRAQNPAAAHFAVAATLRARLAREVPAADEDTVRQLSFHLSEILGDVLHFLHEADGRARRRPSVLSLAHAVQIHWPYHERGIKRQLRKLQQLEEEAS